MLKVLRKSWEPFRIYQLTSTANPAQFTGLAVLVSWTNLKGSHYFLRTFSVALYHKWVVKTGFTFALQFLMLISDSLGGVRGSLPVTSLTFHKVYRYVCINVFSVVEFQRCWVLKSKIFVPKPAPYFFLFLGCH